jgi:hypothetical protein
MGKLLTVVGKTGSGGVTQAGVDAAQIHRAALGQPEVHEVKVTVSGCGRTAPTTPSS